MIGLLAYQHSHPLPGRPERSADRIAGGRGRKTQGRPFRPATTIILMPTG
jgi:hypothetical protein